MAEINRGVVPSARIAHLSVSDRGSWPSLVGAIGASRRVVEKRLEYTRSGKALFSDGRAMMRKVNVAPGKHLAHVNFNCGCSHPPRFPRAIVTSDVSREE